MSEQYRLYVDESGDHIFQTPRVLEQENHRYLTVAGCWFVKRPDYVDFRNRFEALKQDHFEPPPDEIDPVPVVLHREDMVQCRDRFWRLRRDDARGRWDTALLEVLAGARFVLSAIIMDKKALQAVSQRTFDPYSTALCFLLQRYCGYLQRFNGVGDVVAESRGGTEDRKLQEAYTHILARGDPWGQRDANFYSQVLTSAEVIFRRKRDNVAGIQVADLLAHPVRRYVTIEAKRETKAETAFEKRIFGVIERKFNRRFRDGLVKGYGWVLYP